MNKVYGVINSKDRWLADFNGRVFLYENSQAAKAQAVYLSYENAGGPFVAKQVGPEGEPIDIIEEAELPTKTEKVQDKKNK